ncbi:MAG TPA: sugar ABC transporter substrate-binding protein, partial [Candidatus Brocadiia bacterium]|nr:sugar ABC transporter substrate-binding protein [Candidatus Brocadiia bacterium]
MPPPKGLAVQRAMLAALACAGLAAAWAAAADPLIAHSSFASGGATIRFQFWGGAEELDQFTRIARAFVERHPQVRVRLSALPWGQYWAKLQTQAAGGIAPDVFRLYSGAAAEWYDRGVLLDLEPLARRDRLGLDGFYPVALQACRWKGRLLALPSDLPIRVLIYNKDLFDRAGLSAEYPDPLEPMTWSRLVELGRKLTMERDGKVVQFGLSLAPQADVILIHQAGGRLTDRCADPTRATADTPEVEAGLRFYHDLQYKDRIAPDVGAQQEMGFGGGETPLLSGRVAMGMAGPWTLKAYAASGLRLGLAPLFRGAHRAQISTPNVHGVYAGSPHKEAAWQFVAFVASEEGQRLVARLGVGVPALRRVAASPDFTQSAPGFSNLRAFADDLAFAEPLVMFPTPEILQGLDRVTGDLRLKPGVTPAKAAAELQRLIARAIAGQHPRPVPFHSRVTGPALVALFAGWPSNSAVVAAALTI